jgi:NADH-quinone oxidoreductase E subunit
MSFSFNGDNLKRIETLQSRYPDPAALSLPLLWMAQYQEGHISVDAIHTIAKICETAPMEIYRVVTFYTMFNLEPVGKYHIQVCKTLSCKLCGKDDILQTISDTIGIKVGETSDDKKFTLTQVECLGSCGTAPVMQINDVFYENLTSESVQEIIKGLQ